MEALSVYDFPDGSDSKAPRRKKFIRKPPVLKKVATYTNPERKFFKSKGLGDQPKKIISHEKKVQAKDYERKVLQSYNNSFKNYENLTRSPIKKPKPRIISDEILKGSDKINLPSTMKALKITSVQPTSFDNCLSTNSDILFDHTPPPVSLTFEKKLSPIENTKGQQSSPDISDFTPPNVSITPEKKLSESENIEDQQLFQDITEFSPTNVTLRHERKLSQTENTKGQELSQDKMFDFTHPNISFSPVEKLSQFENIEDQQLFQDITEFSPTNVTLRHEKRLSPTENTEEQQLSQDKISDFTPPDVSFSPVEKLSQSENIEDQQLSQDITEFSPTNVTLRHKKKLSQTENTEGQQLFQDKISEFSPPNFTLTPKKKKLSLIENTEEQHLSQDKMFDFTHRNISFSPVEKLSPSDNNESQQLSQDKMFDFTHPNILFSPVEKLSPSDNNESQQLSQDEMSDFTPPNVSLSPEKKLSQTENTEGQQLSQDISEFSPPNFTLTPKKKKLSSIENTEEQQLSQDIISEKSSNLNSSSEYESDILNVSSGMSCIYISQSPHSNCSVEEHKSQEEVSFQSNSDVTNEFKKISQEIPKTIDLEQNNHDECLNSDGKHDSQESASVPKFSNLFDASLSPGKQQSIDKENMDNILDSKTDDELVDSKIDEELLTICRKSSPDDDMNQIISDETNSKKSLNEDDFQMESNDSFMSEANNNFPNNKFDGKGKKKELLNSLLFMDTFDVLEDKELESNIPEEVPFFVDHEPVHFNEIPRRYYKKNKRAVRMKPIKSDSEDEYHSYSSGEEKCKKRSQRKKRRKMNKNEQKKINEWVNSINSTFEEINQFDLVVEKK